MLFIFNLNRNKFASFGQAIEELISNSIDAKSDFIQIEIIPSNFSICVSDNGFGISKKDLEYIGVRHCMN